MCIRDRAPHQRLGNALSAALMRRLYGLAVTDLGPLGGEAAPGQRPDDVIGVGAVSYTHLDVYKRQANRRGGRSKVSGTLRGSVLAAVYILGVTLRYAWPKEVLSAD